MTDPGREIWDGMLAHLREHHATICRQWFEELEPVGVAGGALQLRTSSALHRDYLRRQCGDPFNDAARTVSGRLLSVKFLGPEDIAAKAAPPPPKKGAAPAFNSAVSSPPAQTPQPSAGASASTSAPALVPPASSPQAPAQQIEARPAAEPEAVRQAPSGRYETLVVNPDYAFESFVVGPENRLAHAAGLAVAAKPGRTYNPYFVHGGVGLGKTHILQAVCLKIAESDPRAVMYYTSCEGFMTQYFDCIQSGSMAEFRHRFRDVDVLVIDDIHYLTKRERSQDEFFHTFNALFQANKQIILSSDAPPEEIPDLEDRLVSRFKWGLVAKVEAPCYETRVEILKMKARLRGMTLPDDAAAYIAQRIDTNIRELEGAIVKLHIQTAVEKVPVDLALAKMALGDNTPTIVGEPTIQSIIDAVTDFYAIRLADLQSKLRQRSVALPRQVCMFLARRCTRHSLEEIGGFFGGRDHTTVMHAIKTIEAKRAQSIEFGAILASLEDKVRLPPPART